MFCLRIVLIERVPERVRPLMGYNSIVYFCVFVLFVHCFYPSRLLGGESPSVGRTDV